MELWRTPWNGVVKWFKRSLSVLKGELFKIVSFRWKYFIMAPGSPVTDLFLLNLSLKFQRTGQNWPLYNIKRQIFSSMKAEGYIFGFAPG